ncbi:MAG: sodium/proline symporter [Pseudomonadales bacterium]|nr:sodium/proline symporter [Pseudomonadales bacterium]MCP5185991.1 sodium/proline symporter [Pseudomonadales bacterium]
MTTSGIILTTLVVYNIALLAIGWWATARNRSEVDYFLGGRGVGPFVAGLSYAASTSSAWVFLGFSGFVYTLGLSALWMVPGIWAGYALVWLFFGPRLRRESRERNQVTLTDFLLEDARGPLRQVGAVVAALLILVCFVFYIAAQFAAAGTALVSHFPLGGSTAVVLGAGIVVLYSLLGGFWAVSVTDTLQAGVMMLASILVPVAAVVAAGGVDATFDTLAQTMPPHYLSPGGPHTGLMLAGFLIGTIGMSLGALGQPHLLTRLMAVRGDSARRQGFVITMSWGVVVYVGMVALGLSGRALLPELANSEALFYEAATSYLSPVFAGIVIAATLSAVMSTVDSILLAAAGAVAHDMGVNARYPHRQILASRLVMCGIAVVAVALTLSLPDTIFNRVLFAWSALGAAFGPIVLWRVLGRVVTARGALAAMLAGFVTTVWFYWLGASPPTGDWMSVAAHLPGDPFERVVPWLPALVALLSPLNRR